VFFMTRSRARGFLAALFVGSFAWLLLAAPAGAALPDNRAWEQVSPVEKNGADIGSTGGVPFTGVAVVADGNGAAYFSATPFDGAPNGIVTNFYRSRRGSTGWSTSPFSYPLPTSPAALDIEYAHIFNGDLTRAVVSSPFAYDPGDTDGPDLGHFPIDGWYDQYLFGVSGPAPLWLSHGTVGGDGHTEAIFGGVSNDLQRLVFQSTEKLLPGLPDLAGGYYVYERDAQSGQTQLINVDGGGNTLADGATLGNGSFSGFEPDLDNGAHNAVSDDGTKVFFESPIPGSGSPPKLYLRDTVAGTTTDVSGNTTDDALFAGAASDGSKVFFITSEALTGDDTNTNPALYMYDVGSATLTRVSHGNSGTDDANVAGVAAISDNGAHVYFAAMNTLAANPSGGSGGLPNIYRYDTATDKTAFVATLSSGFTDSNVYSNTEQQHSAFTTPDGKTLVFVSTANLTSYDAQGHSEVYVYHTFPQFPENLSCASCRTNGTAPNGDANLGFRSDPGFNFGWTNPLSDDGSRVFFNTTDSLVGDDANGNVPNGGSQDVYEYSDGIPSLISSGRSNYPSWLASSSPSGNDVFFYTRAALVPGDTDGGEIDVYDARVNGGFPAAPAPPPCEGDACKGAPTAAPFLPVPTTTTTTGANVIPAPVKPKPTFSVTGITRAAANRAARTGRLVLLVRVTASGRIRASAFARLAGKTRRVATTSHAFGAAGSKHLTLRLSNAARAQLLRSGRLALRIDVTYSRGGKRTAHVTLRRSSR
jgi:hypothetical protein